MFLIFVNIYAYMRNSKKPELTEALYSVHEPHLLALIGPCRPCSHNRGGQPLLHSQAGNPLYENFLKTDPSNSLVF